MAMEKVSGKLGGRNGSFVLQHSATMVQGKPFSWTIICRARLRHGRAGWHRGKMETIVEGGKHSYIFEYALP